MKSDAGARATLFTVILGILLVAAIGLAIDRMGAQTKAIAATAQINSGAAQIAAGPPRVAPL